MFKEKERLPYVFFGILDTLVTYLSFYLAYTLSFKQIHMGRDYEIILILIGPIWFVCFGFFGLSKLSRARPYPILFLQYGMANIIGLGVLFFFIFFLKLETISRLVLIVFLGSSIVNNFLVRVITKETFKHFRKKDFGGRINLLIIADDKSDIFIDKLIKNDVSGYNIKVLFTDSDKIINKYINEYTVLPRNTNMTEFLKMESIDEVICLIEDIQDYKQIKKLVKECRQLGITFHMQSPFFKMIASNTQINFLENTPFISFQHVPANYLALKVKLLVDYIVATCALLAFSPFFILIMIIIRLDSKGPVLFTQTRVGKNRRLFKIYKFRTMRVDAEKMKEKLASQNEQSGPVFKMKNDPRITRVGKFLRKTSLDEFPQFINVLLGHMAIVGPRPPIPKEVEQYETWQQRRLSMKPGITCIWQVSGRNNIEFNRWMELDLQYIDNWSLYLDFLLIFKTFKVIFKPTGH